MDFLVMFTTGAVFGFALALCLFSTWARETEADHNNPRDTFNREDWQPGATNSTDNNKENQ